MTVQEIVLSKLKLSTITIDIEMAIEEIETKIRNYCNISEGEQLPKGLIFTQANMVVDLIKNDSPDIADKTVKSVSMGDTSYTFDISNKNSIEKITLNYEADLKAYRRLRK